MVGFRAVTSVDEVPTSAPVSKALISSLGVCNQTAGHPTVPPVTPPSKQPPPPPPVATS